MAKKKLRIPKRVLGYKIPKTIRRSPVINTMLASKAGRELFAAALTAAVTAAAGVLIGERKQIGKTAEKGAKKTAKGAGLVATALERAFEAALQELNLSPKRDQNRNFRGSLERAPTH